MDCGNQRRVLRVRASERYLVLEFRFDLNQWCRGVGTRGKGVPTPLFLALHPCSYDHITCEKSDISNLWKTTFRDQHYTDLCIYVFVPVAYRIRILESNPAGYLDWISFPFQPDPDYPNEINCACAKKFWYGIIVVWGKITIFQNHITKNLLV